MKLRTADRHISPWRQGIAGTFLPSLRLRPPLLGIVDYCVTSRDLVRGLCYGQHTARLAGTEAVIPNDGRASCSRSTLPPLPTVTRGSRCSEEHRFQHLDRQITYDSFGSWKYTHSCSSHHRPSPTSISPHEAGGGARRPFAWHFCRCCTASRRSM
jgi:hypothetical protein